MFEARRWGSTAMTPIGVPRLDFRTWGRSPLAGLGVRGGGGKELKYLFGAGAGGRFFIIIF